MQSMDTDLECPPYLEVGKDSPPPPYDLGETDVEAEICEDIRNYYYGDRSNRGSITLGDESDRSSTKWGKYLLLPLVYIIAITTATLLHRSIILEENMHMPNFLMAVYNTISVVLSLIGVAYNPSRENEATGSRMRRRESDHWKPFAFIFLYMASEEAFWFSIASMPSLMMQRVAYLAYPLLLVFFTYEWVFAGTKRRLEMGVDEGDLEAWKLAAMVGTIGVCWSYRTSFEWWGCMVGVAGLAFKNVVTRDILMTSPHNAPELIMLASSAVSFRALVSCYGSTEYSMVWPDLTNISWENCLKALLVGVCYGIAQLVSGEMVRVWEPVRGSWVVVAASATGVIGCLVFGI
ncbi:hypothetical protein TWF481_010866 [Arthrobotrys musiformis]|uniref:Uncharacterized protein n=1 Tax=Arthrobotrys musiformis TaxID=47236 RepID=A0AAV9W1Z2_9PEZI